MHISDKKFKAVVEATLRQDPKRILYLHWKNHGYWIKRQENLRFRMRLQKGNPKRSFKRERAALTHLYALGVPVPKIVLEGKDYFVLEHSGETILSWMQSNDIGSEEREKILIAAASALADLHAKNICHGRPAIRDMVFNDGKISFLDLENFSFKPPSNRRKAIDLLIFAHSLYRWSFEDRPEIDACLAVYRRKHPEIWNIVCKWCAYNRWINFVTQPLQNRKTRSKDFHPIPFLFKTFW